MVRPAKTDLPFVSISGLLKYLLKYSLEKTEQNQGQGNKFPGATGVSLPNRYFHTAAVKLPLSVAAPQLLQVHRCRHPRGSGIRPAPVQSAKESIRRSEGLGTLVQGLQGSFFFFFINLSSEHSSLAFLSSLRARQEFIAESAFGNQTSDLALSSGVSLK